MKNPEVSVIIPTYKDWPRLALCLKALEEQSYDRDKFEIIVVNNMPGDEVPLQLEIPENCRIIEEQKPGSYAARNSALKICQGRIVGFTDSDCIPDKDWIKNAVDFLTENPEIKRVGGAIEVFSQRAKPSKVELYDEIFAFPQEAYVRSGNAVTANLFTYKEVFDKIGLFDQSLMSGGDYQWGKLAQNRGFFIGYAADAIVKHPARPTVKELLTKAKRVGKGQAGFHSSRSQGFFETLVRVLKILKPRLWEAKLIFQRGRHLSLERKIYLVLLRHYVVATGDFYRLLYERKRPASKIQVLSE